MSQIIGVIPILATPFNKNGDINFKDYEKECEFLINADVNEDGFINVLDVVMMANILLGGLP